MNDGAVGAVNSPPRQLPRTCEPLPLYQCHVWCLHNSVGIAISVHLELHDGSRARNDGSKRRRRRRLEAPGPAGFLKLLARERLARARACRSRGALTAPAARPLPTEAAEQPEPGAVNGDAAEWLSHGSIIAGGPVRPSLRSIRNTLSAQPRLRPHLRSSADRDDAN